MIDTHPIEMGEPAIVPVTCAHPGGEHRVACRVWEPRGEARRTVVCVHGLTRTGGDFDRLADRLATRGFRVVCPDMPGRGLSERMPEASMYDIEQYVADCRTITSELQLERVDWVGTSMGGLVGMSLAGMPGNPVQRLLLNDIGPVIARAGLVRIAGYVGDTTCYPDFATAEEALRNSMQSFGEHTDEQFRLLSRNHFVATDEGWVSHLDPLVATAFRTPPAADLDLWPVWDSIECPVTVLRGGESDLLATETAELMTRGGPDGRGPHATLEVFDGIGHAPTLITLDQIASVERFLAV